MAIRLPGQFTPQQQLPSGAVAKPHRSFFGFLTHPLLPIGIFFICLTIAAYLRVEWEFRTMAIIPKVKQVSYAPIVADSSMTLPTNFTPGEPIQPVELAGWSFDTSQAGKRRIVGTWTISGVKVVTTPIQGVILSYRTTDTATDVVLEEYFACDYLTSARMWQRLHSLNLPEVANVEAGTSELKCNFDDPKSNMLIQNVTERYGPKVLHVYDAHFKDKTFANEVFTNTNHDLGLSPKEKELDQKQKALEAVMKQIDDENSKVPSLNEALNAAQEDYKMHASRLSQLKVQYINLQQQGASVDEQTRVRNLYNTEGPLSDAAQAKLDSAIQNNTAFKSTLSGLVSQKTELETEIGKLTKEISNPDAQTPQ